jgi:hypothetical protein
VKTLANTKRVEETAVFVAAELHTLLDRTNFKSHLITRLREACPAYRSLTNIESCLAFLRALALMQADVIADIGTLMWPDEEDRTEEEDGALHAAAVTFMERFEAQNPGSSAPEA